jgi:hypothetical protein
VEVLGQSLGRAVPVRTHTTKTCNIKGP